VLSDRSGAGEFRLDQRAGLSNGCGDGAMRTA
jgi:hypothetical protein